MTGVDWTLPPNLDLVSTVSPFCIRVMPSLNAPVGSSGVITAQAITTTGCTLSASNPLSFKIYEAETPPAPSGYITLDLDSGDPCDDPVYVVNFHAPHPYRNGITTVSPGIILGGNHPIGHGHDGEPSEPITITVCNVNLCSGKKSCITFEVDPPQPCFGKEEGQADSVELGTSIVAAVNFQDNEEIAVFPNPSDGRFYLTCPANTAGELTVFDSAGKQVAGRKFESWDLSDSISDTPLPRGVYFIRILMAGEISTKKLVVQ
ncbi:MAG TPA: T9SS type A sorting domain-containing protein [Flavilitoribacter sp.]|nr:T9SS type A sorting domain-containing protein [Flavilitoribacter sp.]